MPSQKQIEANRRNALKSTGPRTPKGKSICATNASRYRSLAETVLLAGEERAHFIRFGRQFHSEFLPVGPIETAFVNEMVAAAWRCDRASILESFFLAHAQSAAPSPDTAHPSPRADRSSGSYPNAIAAHELAEASRVLPILGRDAAQHHREFHRALAALKRRQTIRYAAESKFPSTGIGAFGSEVASSDANRPNAKSIESITYVDLPALHPAFSVAPPPPNS